MPHEHHAQWVQQMAFQYSEPGDGTSHSQQKQQVCLAFPYQFHACLSPQPI